ncbi:hypothetical protein N665_0657s0001 [Sinapis alba]|nr:hypothetical protein N665_0657s0001 [Sinapis alba]
MAVLFAVQKSKHYLIGRRFVVHTDQKSLKFLLEQKEVSMEYHKWLTRLLGYQFDILYKPGCENKVADGLSRNSASEVETGSLQLLALIVPQSIQLQDILAENEGDASLTALRTKILGGENVKQGYTVVENRMFYRGRLMLPPTSRFIPLLLAEFHDGLMGGHSGALAHIEEASAAISLETNAKTCSGLHCGLSGVS